jgi:hypothetical protein
MSIGYKYSMGHLTEKLDEDYKLLSRTFARQLIRLFVNGFKNDNPIAERLLMIHVRGVNQEHIRNIKVLQGVKGKPMFFTCEGINMHEVFHSKVIRAVLVEQCPYFKYELKDLEKFMNKVKCYKPQFNKDTYKFNSNLV